jgi:hypothetical protein
MLEKEELIQALTVAYEPPTWPNWLFSYILMIFDACPTWYRGVRLSCKSALTTQLPSQSPSSERDSRVYSWGTRTLPAQQGKDTTA